MKRELSALSGHPTSKRPNRTSYNPAEEIKRLQSDSTGCNDQSQCPLFSVIPPEIRNDIFRYALAEVETVDDQYDINTCWRRPGYLAPHRTHTDLLRTCKRIYSEAWHLPWAGAEHVFYFAWDGRKPERTVELNDMQDILDAVYLSQGEQDIEHIHIFAQLCNLEDGSNFRSVCDLRAFHPRRLTVTIRHTDFWSWEDDAPMSLSGAWVSYQTELPESVTEFKLDLESIVQRKDSVDFLADNIAEKWHLKRKDGAVLLPEPIERSVMTWTGSSTWQGRRWIGDEVRENELDYYVRTVTFKLNSARLPKGNCPNIDVPDDVANRRRLGPYSIPSGALVNLGVPTTANAETIRRAWFEGREEMDDDDGESENEDYDYDDGGDEDGDTDSGDDESG